MRTTAQMRSLWAPAGPSHNNAKFTFWDGSFVYCDKRMLEALSAVDWILRKYAYRLADSKDDWGYANRAITGGQLPSLHAFGIAFDLNALRNRYGKTLVTDMERAMVEEIEAIHTTEGHRVWRWGGDWNDNEIQDDSSYDAMHIESQASPAELAKGIDWSTVHVGAVGNLPEPRTQSRARERALEEDVRPFIATSGGPNWLVISDGTKLVKFQLTDATDTRPAPDGYGPIVEVAANDLDGVVAGRDLS